MGARQTSDPSLLALFDLITSERITAVIYVAARLGIADVLAEGAKTSDELAQRTGAHERSLLRLLRALVALGVCKQVGKGQFELTAVGGHLAADSEMSLKAWALLEGEWMWQNFGSLIVSVRSGRSTAALSGFDSGFDRMAESPETVRIFNEAMSSLTRIMVPAVLAAYDFSGISSLIDVGGGYGELLSAILKAYPTMRGVVFDLPRCAEGAEKQLLDSGVSERAKFAGGSFLDSVPAGGDALILKSIIMCWDDDHSLKLLENCRKALGQGGRLLLVERIVPEVIQADPSHLSTVLSDLNMLRGPGGRERTENEYRDLLRRSGFRLTRVLPAGRSNVIEATHA